MATKKKHPDARKAVAKLLAPNHKAGEALVATTRQQVDSIKLATEYPNHAAIQAAVATLTTSTDSLDKTLTAIVAKRAELATLIGVRDLEAADVTRDRSTLQTLVTAASQGSAEAIRAWNCTVQTKTTPAPSTDAPLHLVLKNDRAIPGTLSAKCKAVKGAPSYVFVFTTDANAAPGTGTLVASTKARCTIPGQSLGHVVYARVAALRPVGGQSAWSEPVQILVR